MPYDLRQLQADVAQIQHAEAGFGSGRLIAKGLILTAAHVLWGKDRQTGPKLTDWQVRLARNQQATKWPFETGNRVVWHDRIRDLALIQAVSNFGEPHVPALRTRLARITTNDASPVEARGYPRASKQSNAPRKLVPVRGWLTAADVDQPLRFGIEYSDLPNDPRKGWPGISGSTVLLVDWMDSDTIWIYGVVQDVPANFDRQLSVSRLDLAWQDNEFRNLLVAAGLLDVEPQDPQLIGSVVGWHANVASRRSLQSALVETSHGYETIIHPLLVPPLPSHELFGRENDIGRIANIIVSADKSSSVLALFGLPGVGKTTLAIQVAHEPRVQAHFSDGILWAGLGQRGEVFSQLTIWAKAVGLTPQETSGLRSLQDWAIAIRSRIGARRILIIVDDAWSVVDALGFFVGGPNCVTVVTTRFLSVASGLSSRQPYHVMELSDMDGFTFLSRFVPPSLLECEQAALRQLATAVGGLPLAIFLMAKRLQSASQAGQLRRLRTSISELKDSENRLKLVHLPAPTSMTPNINSERGATLATVIGLSANVLTEKARRALSALAIFAPKPNTFSENAALAAIGSKGTLELDALVDSGLLEVAHSDRYWLHQTVRDYASGGRRSKASAKRLVEYYRNVCTTSVSEENLVLDWTNLDSAMSLAFEEGIFESLIAISTNICNYYLSHGTVGISTVHLERAADAAKQPSHRKYFAHTLLDLARVYDRIGEYTKAEPIYQDSLHEFRRLDDSRGSMQALAGIGWMLTNKGDYLRAKKYFSEALQTAATCPDAEAATSAAVGLGSVLSELGNYEQATSLLSECKSSACRYGDSQYIASIENYLGRIAFKQGMFSESYEHWMAGLNAAKKANLVSHVEYAIGSLAVIEAKKGRWSEAENLWAEGLAASERSGFREHICTHLQNLGWARVARGDPIAALDPLERALDLSRQIGLKSQMSFTLSNMGLTLALLGKVERSISCMEEALSIARQIRRLWLTTSVLVTAGEQKLALNHFEAAYSFYKEALDMSIRVGHREHSAIARLGLAHLHTSNGDTQKAQLYIAAAIAYFQEENHYLLERAHRSLDDKPVRDCSTTVTRRGEP
ncbi:tetratricopeptide repeat protein [Methylobacterium oryzisoli]|uniref:tetratricopeptide repeat protein n=1 Tax=Methylobacterium oryzisoli TaxID=3385502 RepID=UPI003891D1FE